MSRWQPPWERNAYRGPARRRPKRPTTETVEPKEGPMQTLRIPDDAKQPNGEPGLSVTGRVCAPGATVRTKNHRFAKELLDLGAELIEGPQGEKSKPAEPHRDSYNPEPRRARVAAMAANAAKRGGLKGKALQAAVTKAVAEWNEAHPATGVKTPLIEKGVRVPTLAEVMAAGYPERAAVAVVAEETARRNQLVGAEAEALISGHLAAWDAEHPELAEGESVAAPTDPVPSVGAEGQVEEPGDSNAGEGAVVEDAPAEGESDGQSTGDADSDQAKTRDTDKPDQSRRRSKKKSRRR